MYAKLFGTLIHSTVWREDLHIKVIWITMLAMADEAGDVWASIPGLADAARVTIEQCQDALARLSAPDPFSRTKDHEGRRIEAVEGGWRLLNYAKYRDLKSAEHRRAQVREAVRRHRAERKSGNQVKSDVIRGKPVKAHTDTEAEAETEETTESPNGDSPKSAPPIPELWAVYLEELGGRPPYPRLTETRRRKLAALYREQLQQMPDPPEAFRAILRRVRASEHHMSKREYQMPESLFRSEERRDRWASGHVGGADRGDDLPASLRNEPIPLGPDEDLSS